MNTKRITKIIIGVAVIGAAVTYLLYQAVESSWVYYYSVDEFVESELSKNNDSIPNIDDNRIVRLAGRVENGSVVRNSENMQLDFRLAGQRNSIAVRFYGMVSKNFADNREIIVEGKVGTDGIFKANRILTRCESKYKVRLKIQD